MENGEWRIGMRRRMAADGGGWRRMEADGGAEAEAEAAAPQHGQQGGLWRL